ncbi:MAG TPA: tetratricopeptide repeat protein, partial [Thermoanaerobaculia bacterium]|nr:tetratricopeptide repeat protein [Thermoanaerobaculia bacterium]
ARLLPEGSVLFTLPCHFDEGGPWGGTRDLFRTLLPGLQAEAGDLLARHDYELVHVLPDLKPALGIRNPSLTDLASNEERVRNYPADRAMRIVHGLIDLVIAFKERSDQTAGETWIFLCADYDCAGHITQVFLRELMRRAGTRLHLFLIPLGSASGEPELPAGCFCRALPFGVEKPVGSQRPNKEEATRLAGALEAQVGNDILESTAKIPDLIRLWRIAERPDKIFEWQYKALNAFNTLGLYVDAIRYGEPARELFQRSSGRPIGFLWGLFFKLFMCYIATNALESAQRLAEEDVLTDKGDAADASMRVRLCYLMAMLHARYLPVRDFATGERYLELGLAYLHKAALPESEHFFQLVFNRNGLAMIRSFQGRHQEALDLCREGCELLEKHLNPGQHRLHRSVLFYNMAQVYAQIEAFDLAIEHYSAAMRMDPNYSEYYNERGNLLLKLGRLEEAHQDYLRAIELGPPYFEVWSNLGQCCRVRGCMDEAIAAYDRSLDLQPDQPMVWIVRAQALEALGRLGEAIDAYNSALTLQPMLWPAFAGRAVLLYEQGKVGECLADLDLAVSLAPDEPDIYQNRAVARGDLGRYEEASRDLQRYLELRPDAPDRAEVEARLRDLSSTLSPALP